MGHSFDMGTIQFLLVVSSYMFVGHAYPSVSVAEVSTLMNSKAQIIHKSSEPLGSDTDN